MSSGNSSHIHIVTLGSHSKDTADSKLVKSPKSFSDRPRAKSATLSKMYKLPPARRGSAAISRRKTSGDKDKQESRVMQLRAQSAEPNKIHTYPLTFTGSSSATLAIKSSENVQNDSVIKLHPNNHPGYPVGAHTAGFYTKMRSDQLRTSPTKGVSIASLISSVPKPEPKQVSNLEGETDKKSFGISFQQQQPHKRQAISFLSDITTTQINGPDSWKPEPDQEAMEELLAQLTDSDSHAIKISESLSELLLMVDGEETDPPLHTLLYNSGAIPILLELIPRFITFSEVQVHCCILINYILNNCSDACDPFMELNGLKTLLKASEASSRGYLSKKSGGAKPGVIGNAIGNGILHQGASSFFSAGRTSVASNNRVSIALPNEIPGLLSISENQEKFRQASPKHVSLQSEALSQFFQDGYLDDLDFIGSDKRRSAFSQLLTLYQKIDRSLGLMTTTSQSNNIDNAIDSVLGGTSSILGVQEIILYRYDATSKELFIAGYGIEEAEKFSPACGIVGKSLLEKQLFSIQNPKTHPDFFQDIDYPFEGKLNSMMVLPIFFQDESPAGVLVAFNKQTPPPHQETLTFDKEDEYIFRMIGLCCSIIMSNGNVYQSMSNTQKKVTVLLETTRSLASILDLDTLIKVIMDSAKELLSSDRCTLFLHDPERKQLVFIVQGRDSVQEIRIPSNAGIAGAAFTSGECINILNAYKDPRFNPEIDRQTGYVTKTILCMPIKNILGETIGVMQMINKRIGVFTAEDEMILSSFCSQAAVAIEKSQLFKKTEDMRVYLQSILSSITSCVVTLSESMKLNTINRTWFAEALGVDPAYMKEHSAEKWLSDQIDLLKDIRQVYHSQEAVFVTDFEIKGKNSTLIVNYQVMPLIGGNGVVLVLDDISSEKRAVMTLGRYMSPALAKQVMEEGSGQLGGKRKKVSILFSDIRSFTTLSEGMDPPQVVELLNHHFTDAVNAITEEQGILDKFIGDAVMAVFGVPFASPEDAIRSCNAALRMRDSLVITNKNRQDLGKMTIKIGIGVNTGMVLSGNIGSLKRMEFSCIGDAVNLASRVEGLTKFYGVQILITEFTLAECGDAFLTREVDTVVVTGKKNSVTMYELLGRKDDKLDFDFLESVRMYGMALHAYKRREFALAAETFNSAVESTNDGPSKVLLDRCKKYIEHPPPKDWKGEYTSEGK